MNKERINELKELIPNEIWNEALGNSAENGFESDFETLKEAIRILSNIYEEHLLCGVAEEWDESPFLIPISDGELKGFPWPNYEE